MPQPQTMSPSSFPCPNCEDAHGDTFYSVESVPTHSVLLFDDPQKAAGFQKGDINLAYCPACDFIWNASFDAGLEAYGLGYEATQAYSATFNRFHRELAEHVISRFDLRNKKVVEIGCGQGEFLNLLCDLGNNQGVGFDPAFDPTRRDIQRHPNAMFVADFYSEKYTGEDADLFCCKMTLEHIPNTLSFMRNVRQAIGDKPHAAIFFMIPNADYILDECAFWDVYYEHCSYFTPNALNALMSKAGFAVTDIYPAYDDQYLIVEAGVSQSPETNRLMSAEPAQQRVETFATNIAQFRSAWTQKLKETVAQNGRIVVWGGGSKAVSFLTTLDTAAHVKAAVDINPHKRGTFLPGTGHPVIAPQDLTSLEPNLVVVMNPIYMDEIKSQLAGLDLSPDVLPITEYLPELERARL